MRFILRSAVTFMVIVASVAALGAFTGSAASGDSAYSACTQGRSWLGHSPGVIGFSVRCRGLRRRPLVMFRISRPGIRHVSLKPSARRPDGEPATARCNLLGGVPECRSRSRGSVVIRGRFAVRPHSRCSSRVVFETRLLGVCGKICLLPADWRTISDQRPSGCLG
jgi:hypothetical protein